MWAAANSPKPAPVKKVVVKKTRLICGIPAGYAGDEVISSPAPAFEKRTVEAVGEGYERLLEKIWGVHVEAVPTESGAVADELESTAEDAKYQAHKKKKGGPTSDLYELLGIGHLRWQATQEEIKVAYRKAALLYHPDKSESKDDTMFKAVGAAWDTLSDARKRRDYDSSDPFDDALPTAESIQSESDFFKVYGAVFKNNAKWSKKVPVPDLGDINTPYTQVETFYTFWIRFQTWREFAYLNEYDPETAECREEKRWMERKNAKLQADKRKEETMRLNKLVDQAYNRDPRIVARKNAQLAEKTNKKVEKQEAARRAKEEAAAKVAAAEAERLAAEAVQKVAAAEAKVLRDKAKKLLRKKRQALRQFGTAHNINFETIEPLCEGLPLASLEQLTATVDDIEGTKTKIAQEFENIKSDEEKKKEVDDKAKAERLAQQAKAEEAKEVKWTPEELSILTKALARFPAGSANRWEQISAYMHHTKTEGEIIAKIKSVKNKDLKEKPATRELEDSFQRFLKVKKEATVVSGHSVRYDGSDVGPEAAAEAAQQEAEEQAAKAPLVVVVPATNGHVASSSSSNGTVPNGTSPLPNGTAKAPNGTVPNGTAPVKTTPAATTTATEKVNGTETKPVVANGTSTPAASTTTTTTDVAPTRDWSPEEQASLEVALKKYPTTTENRWDVIAAAVPGRTRKECVDRFKYLVSIVKGAKK